MSMSDEEIFHQHPWVMAAQFMNPEVVPAVANVTPVIVTAVNDETNEEEQVPMVMLLTATSSGVSNVFMDLGLWEQFFSRCVEIDREIRSRAEKRPEPTPPTLEVVTPQEFKRDRSLGRYGDLPEEKK